MARSGYLGIAVIAIVMAISFQEGMFRIFFPKKNNNNIKFHL